MSLSFLVSLRYPLKALFEFNRRLMLSTFGLMMFKSASSGMTLLMILPLLGLLGFSVHPQSMPAGDTSRISMLFQFFGLSPSLSSVLILFSFAMCLTAYVAYQEQCQSTRLQQNYNQHLRALIHRAIFFSDWSFLTQQKKSDLVHVLMNETQNISLCNYQMLSLMNQVCMIFAHTCIAFYLSFAMTWIAILTALGLLALMWPVHRLTLKAGQTHLKANQQLQQVLTEQLGALKLIKSSGLEAFSHAQFETSGAHLRGQQMQFQVALARNKLLYACCSAIFFSALLYVGIQYLQIPIAQFVVLLMIYARILPMISSAQQVYQIILHKISSYEHVQSLLQEAYVHQDFFDEKMSFSFEHAISLQEVSFIYPETDYPIFSRLTLQLRKNTTVALIGPSGIGKTTLVDLIVGLIEPTSGQIFIDDVALSATHRSGWRRKIAYMTQDVFLFNTSIRENLLWFNLSSSEEEIHHALILAAAEFVFHLPQGLDSIVGENGVFLSGGERQRLGLARAILQKPALLILDESTNALDQERATHIYGSLIALKGKMTMIVISHHDLPQAMIDETINLAHHADNQAFLSGESLRAEAMF